MRFSAPSPSSVEKEGEGRGCDAVSVCRPAWPKAPRHRRSSGCAGKNSKGCERCANTVENVEKGRVLKC